MLYIYRHLLRDNGFPFYIGIGSFDRFGNSKRANCKSGRNPIWKKMVNQHGFGEVEIMCLCDSREEANEKEKFFIKLYGKKKDGGILANISDGGDGMVKGAKLPDWWRKRISLAVTGTRNHNYGKNITPEHKDKISKANKGKPKTDYVKRCVSVAQRGVPNPRHQVENQRAWALSEKNKNRGANHGMARKVRNTLTGVIYGCIRDAAKSIGVSSGCLQNRLYGFTKNKTGMEFA